MNVKCQQAVEKVFFVVILSSAKNLNYNMIKKLRDSSSPGAPQNDRSLVFFKGLSR